MASSQEVFINEIHYDNAGTDVNEAIEIAGEAGIDLTGWSIVLYNGSNGTTYNTTILSETIADSGSGIGFVLVPFAQIQNGSPDGVALVNASAEVVQFLSYEGSFTAVGGPAAGLASEDIGIAESSTSPVGNSLQLTGTGLKYEDFSWSAIPHTFGTLNTGQSFGDVTGPGEVELATIAEARLVPQGTITRIRGILTASDQLGGPAFIQDNTAGIPVFDAAVHGTGLYEIGDELEIVGALSQFNAMIQLGSVSEVVKISEGNEVVPVATTITDLPTLEGRLVFIDEIVFETGGRLTVGNHEVSDATGTVEIRIDNDVESLIGRRKPDETTTLTGVVGSFNGELQMFPRFEPDLPGTEEFVIEPPAGEDIPVEETLDVATWNMEFFGSTLSGFGPSDIELQKLNALMVIDSLKADIIAVQEVSDIDFLAQALAEHTTTSYAVICSDVYSYSFEPDDGTFPPQQLCFIYNTATVSIVDERVVFEAFYTAARTGQISDLDYPTGSPQSFWSSGRLPFMVTAQVNILGATETIKLVNVHGKSGSSPEDIARKTYDYSVLKDTLDTYYVNDKMILLGDYNDDVDVSIGGGITPLQPFVTDVSNYDIVSSSFSYNGQNSTVYFNDVIDHITITDELFEPYIADSEYLLDPRDFITDYGNTTSDHFPSRTRFVLETVPIDPLVVTLPENITLYRGYEEMSTALMRVEIEGGLEPYLVEWSNNLSGQEIEVIVEDEGELTVWVTDASGLEVQRSVYIEVEDVSCRKGWFSGLQMCLRGRIYCVPEHLVEHFLSKGYELGACNNTHSKIAVKASPNPFYNNLDLQFYSEMEVMYNVEVINYYGQVVYNTDLRIMPGRSINTLDLAYLRSGLYLIKITDHNSPMYFKILKVFKR